MTNELLAAIRKLLKRADDAAEALNLTGDNQISSLLYTSVEEVDALLQKEQAQETYFAPRGSTPADEGFAAARAEDAARRAGRTYPIAIKRGPRKQR